MQSKYLKYIIYEFYGFAIILAILLFSADSNQDFKVISTNDYTIENYDIDMIVKEENKFDIIETITVNFNVYKHGIERIIPLKNYIIRNDGTKSNNKAKITDIKVSEKATLSTDKGQKVLKIGTEDKTYIGKHSYIIKYTYDIGKDPLNNEDELYFNLVGNQWDTSINNIKFKIKMPKSFDESLLGFSSGYIGSTNNANVSYNVSGNTITGYLIGKLNAGQALTIRLSLPEGYFVGARNNKEYDNFLIIFSLLCLLISYIIWIKYGKNDKIIETVEFYPPNGFNSAEVGFLYKGTADTESVISLLIYLANAGYLSIEETEKQEIFGKSKGFKITKIKEYNGNNENEKLFFDGLFEKTSSVTESDLYNKFYLIVNKIKDNLNSKENKKKIFEESSQKKKKWIIVMLSIIGLLFIVKPSIEYFGILEAISEHGLLGLVLLTAFNIKVFKNIKINTVKFIIFKIICFSLPYFLFIKLIDNLIMGSVGIIISIVLIVLLKMMPKRTSYGCEMLGKLKGLKRFLETAEKNQLEDLVSKNPEYFYNILPYTYALDISDVWMNQFETIAIKAPNWYHSSYDFNMSSFKESLSTTMSNVYNAVPSKSSNKSGGGSAGRGSGGGGGRSW